MPRNSRSRPAPRPAPRAPPQTRGAHTAAGAIGAHPPVHAPAPPAGVASHAQPKQPGLLAQMASTAGGVAVGSTIGHGLSSMLFGGRNEPAPAQEAQQIPVQQQQNAYGATCDFQAKEFTKCLETGDVNSCSWYLEQLKQCQAAARPY